MVKSVNVGVIQNKEIMENINKWIDEVKFGKKTETGEYVEISETEKYNLITKAYSEILKLKNVYNGELRQYVMPGFANEFNEDNNENNLNIPERVANHTYADKDNPYGQGVYDRYLDVYSAPKELMISVVNEAFLKALDKYKIKDSKFMNLFFTTLGYVAKEMGHIYNGKTIEKDSPIANWRNRKAKDLIKQIAKRKKLSYQLPKKIISRKAFYTELAKIRVEGQMADEIVDMVFGASEEEIFASRDIGLDKVDSPMAKEEAYTIDDVKVDDTIVIIYEVLKYVASMANDSSSRKTKVYKSYVKICTTYKIYDQELCDVDKLKELLTQEVLNWLRANKVLEAKGRFIDKAYISIDRKVREAKKRGTDISESVINTRISNAHKNIENQFPGRIIGRYKYYDGDGNIHSNIEWNKINELKDICNEDYYYKARENIANVERAYLESMAYLSKKGKF